MALLGVMRDLYEVEELKMNIKFEVSLKKCQHSHIQQGQEPFDFTAKMGGSTPSSLASFAIPGGSFGGKMDKTSWQVGDSPVIPNASYLAKLISTKNLTSGVYSDDKANEDSCLL